MKILKNKFLRLALFVVGFIGIVAAFYYGFTAIMSYGYFRADKDSSKLYAESQDVQDTVYSSINYIIESAELKQKADNGPLDENDEMYLSFHLVDGVNSIYSFDGRKVEGADIYDVDDIGGLSKDENGEIKDEFASLKDKVASNADIFVSYDAATQKLEQWYKTEKGELKNYTYLENDGVYDSVKNAGISFACSMKIYNEDSFFVQYRLIYEMCMKPQTPILWTVIGIILFIMSVVLLTIGEDKKIMLLDKIPYLIQFGFTFLFIFAVVFSAYLMSKSIEDISRLLLQEKAGVISFALLIMASVYILCAAVYLSIVRRIKCGKFFDGFIIIFLCKWLYKKLKSFLVRVPGKNRLIAFIAAYWAVTLLLCLIILIANGYMNSAGTVFFLLLIQNIINFVVTFFVVKYLVSTDKLLQVSKRIEAGELDAKIDTSELAFNSIELGESLNGLGDGLSKAIERSVRDERTKAELITNVSHDIKTPLTSIINYVDLLKKEDIENPKAKEYVDVIEKKSDRLKQLILDLIEASKASTGNIELEKINLNFVELLSQVRGEYDERFAEKGLEIVETKSAETIMVSADGRRMFRVLDNVLGNVYKYTMPNTRVYMDLGLDEEKKETVFSIKNVSSKMLNISPEELTERFVRGDRSRNTEGSGLGLSIAKNLVELHGGTFDIEIDGDLFKVIIKLPTLVEETSAE